MSILHETEAQQILETAYDQKAGQDGCTENPVVLSCGGIFIPQPRNSPLKFHILNTANEGSPSKVVSGIIPKNMLHLVMAKENMN